MTDAAYPTAGYWCCPRRGPEPWVARSRRRRCGGIELSLPTIHCAARMTGVEAGLMAEPEVAAARVNLTLKRPSVTVEDSPGPRSG